MPTDSRHARAVSRVVAGQHHDIDAGRLEPGDSACGRRPDAIGERNHAQSAGSRRNGDNGLSVAPQRRCGLDGHSHAMFGQKGG